MGRMRRTRRAGRSRPERGAAAVEMALVLFILIPLVFGIISFGIVFAQQLALGNAARQAARFGVVAERTCADIKTEAQAAATTLAMSNPDEVDVSVGLTEASAAACNDADPPCEASEAGENVYVTVRFESELIVPLGGVYEPKFDLEGRGVFRCEYS